MRKLVAFDMPESPEQISEWLELILCEGDLRGLVSQLNAVHPPSDSVPDLDQLLAEHRPVVLSNGLSALPSSKLQFLLVTPTLLLDLQETIMVEGGEYWHSKFRSDAGRKTIQETEKALADVLRNSQVDIDHPEMLVLTWFVPKLLALAAGLLIVIGGTWYFTQQRNKPESVQLAAGWGWENESAIPIDGSPTDYLVALSDGAEGWFKKRPSNRRELIARLAEFSSGCERLIHSSHAPLSAADRAWLQYKCRGWKKQIDEQLATADQKQVASVLGAADEIARDISESLTRRAAQG